jgi:radical SAM superfamily enzyme YgiQ (UPF0313 family)
MRVLFVYPDARHELIGYGDLGAIAEPLALEYLSAVAVAQGAERRLLDLRLHRDALDATLAEFRPDVVAVTGYSMHVLRMIEICQRAKQILPRTTTVVGGHHATLMADDFLIDPIDLVVVGEGTRPFGELLRRLAGNQALSDVSMADVPGIWHRRDGVFSFSGTQAEIEIDELPLPDRTITAADRAAYFIDWMRPIALMRTTVGCPYRCSFCSLWRVMDGQYHKRDVEYVVDELATIQEDAVFLVDDEPFVNPRRMLALAQAIQRAGIRKRYFAYCRVDTLLRNRDVMAAWKEIGLERVFLGIEGITAREMADYNKRQTVGQIERALREARSLGISVFGGFIINPNYTPEDFKQVVRFIQHNRVDYPSFTILTPLPGTPDLKADFSGVTELQENGRPQWDFWDLQNPVIPTTLPRKEFLRQYQGLRVTFRDRWSLFQQQARRSGATPAVPGMSRGRVIGSASGA